MDTLVEITIGLLEDTGLDREEMWCFRYGTNINMIVEKYESESVCKGILEEREASGYQHACGEKRSRWPTESQNG